MTASQIADIGVAREVVPLPDADVFRIPGLFTQAESDAWFAACRADLPWRQEHVTLFGREIASPRLTAWHGDPGATYRYSGLTFDPQPWTPALQAIRDRLEAALGAGFNGVLANLYRDGSDSMGWHSDDERELGPDPVIASVSFGATRRFALRHRAGRERGAAVIELEHGSVVVMAGATQRHYRHAVAKTRRRCGPRLNLSYRAVVADP